MMIQWAGQAIGSVKEIALTGRRSFFVEQHNYHVRRFTDSLRSLVDEGTANLDCQARQPLA